METIKKSLRVLSRLPADFAVILISFYQFTISPDHGLFKAKFPYGYCRHYPTCSEYTKQVIQKKGFLKGIMLGFVRILKCNPFVKPSTDIVS